MAAHKELKIKFLFSDLNSLAKQLSSAGFQCVTPSIHEFNTLYDLPDRNSAGKASCSVYAGMEILVGSLTKLAQR